MSWDQLAEELEGLLASSCERALPTAEALALAQDARGCDVLRRGSTLPAPTSQERSRLARCVCKWAERCLLLCRPWVASAHDASWIVNRVASLPHSLPLFCSVLQTSGSKWEALDAALEPTLRRLARGQQSPASSAALVQLHTALNVLTACSNVAGAIQCTPAEGAGLARAGKLLVRSGTAALQAAVPGHVAASSTMTAEQDGRVEFELGLLRLQAIGMNCLLGLTLEAGRLPSVAAADMVAWLEAMAALLAKHGPEGLPGGWVGGGRGGVDVLGGMMTTVCMHAREGKRQAAC